MKVVWDEAKSRSNWKKHGVTFAEAAELLDTDESRLDIFDEEHSAQEARFISIGPVRRGLVLVVWTERDDAQVRLISARWATVRERDLYQSYFGSTG